MEISIQLPFFPGFYETDYKNSDTAYWAIKEEFEYYYGDAFEQKEHPEFKHITEDDLDFDDEAYEKDIMENFISAFKDHAPEIVTDVRFDELDSPRYYNFRNDRLFAFVTLSDEWKDEMRHFIASNYDWLVKRVKDDWTSYDGFDSYMENDLNDWDDPLFNQEDPRYIGTMIGYMMYRDNKNIYNDLLMDTMEEFHDGSYVFIIPETKARIDEMIANGEIQLPDPTQMEIPFEN